MDLADRLVDSGYLGDKKMVFSSTVFLFILLPVTLAIYYNPIIKNRTFKNVFLLFASLAFMRGENRYLFS